MSGTADKEAVMKQRKTNAQTQKWVMCAILTAIVIVLQLLCTFVRVGPFSITLALMPMIIGAALYGPLVGGWLGFVFGVVVLLVDASAFLAVDVLGTVVTVLAKGERGYTRFQLAPPGTSVISMP